MCLLLSFGFAFAVLKWMPNAKMTMATGSEEWKGIREGAERSNCVRDEGLGFGWVEARVGIVNGIGISRIALFATKSGDAVVASVIVQ